MSRLIIKKILNTNYTLLAFIYINFLVLIPYGNLFANDKKSKISNLNKFHCSGNSNFKVDLRNDKHGSLRNFKTQDQAQLGTCYANQGSILLESQTGRSLSFFQLALVQRVYNESLEKTHINGETPSESKFVTSSGNTCEIINKAAKLQIPLCDSKYVPLVNLSEENSSSKNLIMELGKLYDRYKVMTPKVQKFFRKKLKATRAKANSMNFNDCKNQGIFREKIFKNLKQKIAGSLYSLKFKCQDENTSKKSCDNFFGSFGKWQGVNLKGKGKGKGKGSSSEQQYNLDPKLKGYLNKFVEGLKTTSFRSSRSKDRLFKNMFNQVIETFAIENNMTTSGPLSTNRNFRRSFYTNLGKDYFISNDLARMIASYQDEDKCKAYAKLKFYDENLYKICDGNTILYKTFKQISDLSDHFFGDPSYIDVLLEKLDGRGSVEEFLTDMLGPDCRKNGTSIPKTTKCKSMYFPRFILPDDKSQKISDFNGENELDIKCTTEEECDSAQKAYSTAVFRNTMFENLNKMTPTGKIGIPVGIDICTKFMNNEGSSVAWDGPPKEFPKRMQNCMDSGEHGIHAVTVIGMRCKNGKVQYKVQNSWGNNTSYDNPSIESVEKEGSFWTNEEDLVGNTYGINRIIK